MGIYDTPACLDYILKNNPFTNKVIYFGHSQGGASVLVGLTEKLEYFKERLLGIILLAPASRIDSIDSGLIDVIKLVDLDDTLASRNINEILPYDPEINSINIKLTRYYPTMASAMLEMTSDEVSWINCPERIKVYFSHYPSGTSVKSITHFKQLIRSKEFQRFDYGLEENMRRYGSEKPHPYDLSQIRDIPIVLCGGLKDKLTHINDIRWLKEQLDGKSLFSYYEFEYMGHAAFLLNNDITWFNFVLMDIYKIMNNANKSNLTDISTNIESPEYKLRDKVGTKKFVNGGYEGIVNEVFVNKAGPDKEYK